MRRAKLKQIGRWLAGIVATSILGLGAAAAENVPNAADTTKPTEQWWNIHAQATVVPQGHGDFNSPYFSADHSFLPNREIETSVTSTAFAGVSLWKGGEVYLNPELGAGRGLSNSRGVAGFTNAEIYRVGDDAAPKIYLSRLFVRHNFGLGGEKEFIPSAPNQLATNQDISRFTVTAGKFSLNDMFDNNVYSHDPRTQFLNWALMDNGAWDYAADTRGYTWGVVLEYNQKDWAVRFGSVLVPKNANQMELDGDLGRARGDNLEFEYRYNVGGRPAKARLLAYMNQARMGNYRKTTMDPSLGLKIENSRDYSTKYGFGLNVEQELANNIGAFLRLGWNDGATETWAFTEIDRALSMGLSLSGSLWGRRLDTLGIAYVLNAISESHADYLKAGGFGFMVGDGKLNYGLEHILEIYYSLKLHEAFSISADVQEVFNPGYNQDRGPVTVFSGRVHVEL